MCEFCNGKTDAMALKSETTKDIMYLDGTYLITDVSRRNTKETLENSSFEITFCPVCGENLKTKGKGR